MAKKSSLGFVAIILLLGTILFLSATDRLSLGAITDDGRTINFENCTTKESCRTELLASDSEAFKPYADNIVCESNKCSLTMPSDASVNPEDKW